MFYLHFINVLHTANRSSFTSDAYTRYVRGNKYIVRGAFDILVTDQAKWDRYFIS